MWNYYTERGEKERNRLKEIGTYVQNGTTVMFAIILLLHEMSRTLRVIRRRGDRVQHGLIRMMDVLSHHGRRLRWARMHL